MTRAFMLLAAAALPIGPAFAQDHGSHGQHEGHAEPKAEPKPEPKPEPDPHAGHEMPQADDPHAGHDMPKAEDPHAGHEMPAADDPHAGHEMPAADDPHAGHDMGAAAMEIPVGPPPPEALQGPAHAADSVWGGAMGSSRAVLIREHGGMATGKFLLDRAEARFHQGRDGFALDAEGWVGGDIDKLWIKSEVEGAWGENPETAEVQALWSHAIGPFFDLQAGVRADFEPRSRARAVIGVQGLAPYWIEVDAAAFVSTKGDLTARFKAEHDARITQRLILQPAIELDFALQNIPEEHVGAGLSTAEAGLRLRYEISPQFAPYVGVNLERAFGRTRRYLRDEGDDPTALSFVVGLRAWF